MEEKEREQDVGRGRKEPEEEGMMELGGCGVDLSNEKVDPIGLRFDQSVRDTTGP